MLILFKPWWTASGLRTVGTSWESTFAEFAVRLASKHKHIIDNMQILHECHDSRDDHMQIHTQRHDGSNYTQIFDRDQQAENEIEEIDMTDVLQHLEEIDQMSSRKTGAMDHEAQQCLNELEVAGWYDTGCILLTTSSYDDTSKLGLPNEESLEDEWRHAYEIRKAAWKQEAKQNKDTCKVSGTIEVVQMDSTEPNKSEDPMVNDVGSTSESHAEVVDALAAIERTVQNWMLNTKQRRAFKIVAHHAGDQQPDQLLMHLGGPGGTGKSRVVNALWDFFSQHGENHRFRLATYTGIAARNIGGATLHALLHMNESG